MGKLNFCGYFPTHEIREYMTHKKNMFYSMYFIVV